MNNEEQNVENNAPRSNKKLITMIVIAALLLGGLMASAGFAIGRASATPEAITTLQEVTREVTVVAEVAEDTVSSENVGETEAVESAPEPTAPTEVAPETAVEPAPEVVVPQEDVEEIDLATFFEVWALIEQEFDGEVPPNEELLYSAIEGSVKELDDTYTRFIRPDVAARLREDAGGSVEGIGAFVRETDDGFFEIVRPIVGQAAEKAGLLPDDIVLEVDGESVIDMSLDEVILLVRGPEGTDVTLTILREGEEELLEFIITRVRFEAYPVVSKMLEDDIAYIKLPEFNRAAYEKTFAAAEELLAQNPQGLIFDLRDNPGGFVNESVNIADLFLDEGVVLFERNIQGDINQTFSADDGDLGETIPMVVLVNGGSASASEIVAGAIQDRGRAILIGEQTFGKGSVQRVLALSDGSELRVTIARWYTPENNTIDKEGITPDIEVPMAFGAEEDIQLQRAIEYILTGE